MGKIEYELSQVAPKVEAGYSGNLLDPAKVRINKALGRYGAVPPFFIPGKEDIITRVYDANEIIDDYAAVGIIYSVMPMSLKGPGDTEFTALPVEPLVSISGKNVIVRRNVLKSLYSGTVKERWSQDDFEVTIQGVLTIPAESEYPKEHMRKLLSLFDARESVEVKQQVLLLFGITHLAIESVNFPHTKGLNNQNYEIKAYSDDPVSLLIEQ